VILTKDHDPEAECTIFHNDIRSFGKDFERYHQRAEQLPGLNSSEATPPSSKGIPETKNVTIRYATPDDGVKEEEFDMVVLSVGLNPPQDHKNWRTSSASSWIPWFLQTGSYQSHGDQPARHLRERRLSGSHRYSRIGFQRQRRRLPGGESWTTGAESWPRKGSIRRKRMSPRKSPASASSCAIAGPISAASWMSPPPWNTP
jgi:hypothetical protein